MYRHQINITIPEEKIPIIKEHHGKIRNRELAKMVGVTYNKLHKNLIVLGFVRSKKRTQTEYPASNGEFIDIDEFGRHYSY